MPQRGAHYSQATVVFLFTGTGFIFIAMIELKDFEISAFGHPSTPGIYAVWTRNVIIETGEKHLLYIGSSKNLEKRIHNTGHVYMRSFRRLNSMVWISFRETPDYLSIESYLIKKHKPILNKRGK